MDPIASSQGDGDVKPIIAPTNPSGKKRPGPKRDSKPAPSEKLERNRQAQRHVRKTSLKTVPKFQSILTPRPKNPSRKKRTIHQRPRTRTLPHPRALRNHSPRARRRPPSPQRRHQSPRQPPRREPAPARNAPNVCARLYYYKRYQRFRI
jgi:hypothetical protein